MAQPRALDANRRQRAVPDSGRSRRHGDLSPKSASSAWPQLITLNEYVVFTNRETGPDLVPPAFTHAPLPVNAANRPARLIYEQTRLGDGGSAAVAST